MPLIVFLFITLIIVAVLIFIEFMKLLACGLLMLCFLVPVG